MTQKALFDGSDLVTQPRSRRTDHDSSREAARKHAPRAKSNRAIVLAGVKEYPGKTSKELAPLIGLDRWETHRRLSDLEQDNEAVGVREPKCEIRWRLA